MARSSYATRVSPDRSSSVTAPPHDIDPEVEPVGKGQPIAAGEEVGEDGGVDDSTSRRPANHRDVRTMTRLVWMGVRMRVCMVTDRRSVLPLVLHLRALAASRQVQDDGSDVAAMSSRTGP